jgi:hypothetical protein
VRPDLAEAAEQDLALFGTHGSEIFFTVGARVHIQHGLGAG